MRLDELQGASKIIGMFNSWHHICLFFKFSVKGGTFRGNAIGNVYNWGDAVMANPAPLGQKGVVFLYFSNENPSMIVPTQSLPTMKTSLLVFNSTKPLFENLAKKFPDVASKSMLFILDCHYILILFDNRICYSHP